MNRCWLLLVVLLCPVLSLSSPVRAEGPRLGILSDAGSRQEADLLLVELQKAPCELVERDEIRRVLGEQALGTGLNRADSVRIGQLLKADGLILLSALTNQTLAVRVVAVSPGVLLWSGELDLKRKDRSVPPAPVLLARALEIYLPKLAVQKSEAVPLSMMRLRPGNRTARASQLANECYRLLELQLLRDPRLFVLERENLKRVEEEHLWAGQTNGFWSGSYLLEGTVSHTELATNLVTVELKLRPPMDGRKRTGEVQLQEQGRTDQLPQLIANLAGQVLAQLTSKPRQAPWDTAKEGAQFAAMAGRLGDPLQRKNMLETALALGFGERKVLEAYLATLRELCWPNPYRCPVDFAQDQQIRQTAERLLEMLEFCNSYRPREGFTPETEHWWLGLCVSTYSESTPLTYAGRFLEKLHDSGRADQFSDLLEPLRAECRALANRYWLNDAFLDSARGGLWPISYAPYFYDTNREILQLYRKLALPQCAYAGVPSVIFRDQFLIRIPDRPPVFRRAATEPPETAAALWAAYRRDLAAPTTPQSRIDYWVQKMAQTNTAGSVFIARRGLQSQLLADKEYAMAQSNLWSLVTSAFSRVPVRLPGAEETFEHERARDMFLALCGRLEIAEESLVQAGIPFLVEPYRASFVLDPKTLMLAVANREQARAKATGQPATRSALRQALMRALPNARPPEELVALPALVVNREIILAEGQADDYGDHVSAASAPFRWKDNAAWFYWEGDVLGYQPHTRRALRYPVPVKMHSHDPRLRFRNTGGGYIDENGKSHVNHPDTSRWSWWRLDLTESYLVFIYNGTAVSAIALRERLNSRDWRHLEVKYQCRDVAQVAGRLFLLIRANESGGFGIVALDPQSLQTEVVLDPGFVPDPKTPGSFPQRPDLTARILGTPTELFVRLAGRTCCAYNPATKTVRPLKEAEFEAAKPAGPPYAKASLPYGFEVLSANLAELVVQPLGRPHQEKIPLKLQGLSSKGRIPVADRLDYDSPQPASASGLLLTPSSVLAPYGDVRGFAEIPYHDIYQHLVRAGRLDPTNLPPALAVALPPSSPVPLTKPARHTGTTAAGPRQPNLLNAPALSQSLPQLLRQSRVVVLALVDAYNGSAHDYISDNTPGQMLEFFLREVRRLDTPAAQLSIHIVQCGPQTRQIAAELFAKYTSPAPYDRTIPVILVFKQGQLIKTFTYQDHPGAGGVKLWSAVEDHLEP